MAGPRKCSWFPARRTSFFIVVIKQRTLAGFHSLASLPESFAAQAFMANASPVAHPQADVQYQADTFSVGSIQLERAVESINTLTAKLSEFVSTMLQREADREKKIDSALEAIRQATERMGETADTMDHRLAQLEGQAANGINLDLELQLAAGVTTDPRFNWMFGHGCTPRVGARATKSQAKYDRLKTAVRKNAYWFKENSTDIELKPAFIQFNDTPRIVVNGFYIKKLLLGQVDVDEAFAGALVRVMRRDEVMREPDSSGLCHYVHHIWAQKAMDRAPIIDLEHTFMLPKLQYNLKNCRKVVVSLRLNDGWGALSIDLRRATVHLIHPAVSNIAAESVLANHLPLMKGLTAIALDHMVTITGMELPQADWTYDIALKSEHAMHPNESGIAAAFYSIPKDNQFMIVSQETITLALETFLYSLIKMCGPVTRQKVQYGREKRVVKRDRTGKFVAASVGPQASASNTNANGASSSGSAGHEDEGMNNID